MIKNIKNFLFGNLRIDNFLNIENIYVLYMY